MLSNPVTSVTYWIWPYTLHINSYNDDYEEYNHLGCNTVYFGRSPLIFGRTYCLHLQGWRVGLARHCGNLVGLLLGLLFNLVPSEHWWTSTNLPNVTTKTTVLFEGKVNASWFMVYQTHKNFNFNNCKMQSLFHKQNSALHINK
jgi:hypothetical protein